MFECLGGLQPDTLLGVFVGEEQAVLLGVPQSLDLRQPGPNLGAGIQHSRLKKKSGLILDFRRPFPVM